MSLTSIQIRKDDHRELKDEAQKLNQNLIDFVPTLVKGWRELPEKKQLELIKATAGEKREDAIEARATGD